MTTQERLEYITKRCKEINKVKQKEELEFMSIDRQVKQAQYREEKIIDCSQYIKERRKNYG